MIDNDDTIGEYGLPSSNGRIVLGFSANGIGLIAERVSGSNWKIIPKNGASPEQFFSAIDVVNNTIKEMVPHINGASKSGQRCAEINFPGWTPSRVRTLFNNLKE